MNKDSFTKMLDVALPGKESKKMVPHIFRVYDDNNDGFIDFAEFMESEVLKFCFVVLIKWPFLDCVSFSFSRFSRRNFNQTFQSV